MKCLVAYSITLLHLTESHVLLSSISLGYYVIVIVDIQQAT